MTFRDGTCSGFNYATKKSISKVIKDGWTSVGATIVEAFAQALKASKGETDGINANDAFSKVLAEMAVASGLLVVTPPA